jgi:RHS repeat-associated protein
VARLWTIGLLTLACAICSAKGNVALNLQNQVGSERVFTLAIVAAKGSASAEESKALLADLNAFRHVAKHEDCTPIVRFLSQYPNSTYSGSLWLNLGLLRLKQGYYTRASYCLDRAWSNLKDVAAWPAKSYGDRALAELALLDAHSGAASQLESLLAEVKGRPIYGSATQRLIDAKQALAYYQKAPGALSECATDSLLIMGDLEHKKIADSPDVLSTSSRTSLSQLVTSAAKEGLPLTPAFRKPGTTIVFPSIVHFRMGHYAVVTGFKSGHYILRDPSFGGTVAMSRKAFQEEASGYFLLAVRRLPLGWSPVPVSIASKITGAGETNSGDGGDSGDGSPDTGDDGGDDPEDSPPDDEDPGDEDPCDGDDGITRYTFNAMLCGLKLVDTPIGYTPAAGPTVKCRITYNQKEMTDPPATFSNFGPKWRFQFFSYVQDDPSNSLVTPTMFSPGGGFTQNALGTPDEYTGVVLTQTSSNPIEYTATAPNGSQLIYSQSDNGTTTRNVYLTKIVSPEGLYLTLTYQTTTGIKLLKITDQFGRVTAFSYTFASDPYKITKITDPYGRTASFTYDTAAPYHLLSITDRIGIKSSYTYTSGTDFISTLTTPYGVSTFTTSDTSNSATNMSKWVEATDPMGHTERCEFEGNMNYTAPTDPFVPNVPGWTITNNYLNYRNTYYWNKLAYADYGTGTTPDYSKAKVYHWLHLNDSDTTSGILESVKMPLENRQWYFYKGQPTDGSSYATISTVPGMVGQRPAIAARGLSNGNTSLVMSSVNPAGLTTQATDAMGRITNFSYASDNVDLTSVSVQGSGSTSTVVWQGSNYVKHRPEKIIDSNGGTYTISYNAYMEPSTVVNPLGQKTTYVYNTHGCLTEVEGPAGQVLTTYTYDTYDRVMTVKDALGDSKTLTYDADDRVTSVKYADGTSDSYTYNLLDLAVHTDRQGRTTSFVYNPLRQLIAKIDHAGNATNYSWCLCGHLSTITDPNGNSTIFLRDIEGRLLRKINSDGTYEARSYAGDTSWVQSITDAKGQTRYFNYNPDGSVQNATYLGATLATPSVSYTYDPYFPRISSVVDGSGTRSYTYIPYGSPGGGKAATISQTGMDTITLGYDMLARVTSVATGAKADTLTYDSLGRITKEVNPLGTFTYTRYGNTRLPSEISGGPITTTFSYLALPKIPRLSALVNKAGTTTLDDFGYTYNPAGSLATWSGSYQGNSAAATYDPQDRLASWTVKSGSSTVASEAFTYDPMGNRLTSTNGSVDDTYTTNVANEVTAELLPSAHEAYKYGYDANGSLTNLSFTNTASPTTNYTASLYYDGENQLNRYISGTHESIFYHNSLGRVTKILEYSGSTLESTTSYLWMGQHLLEAKTSAGTKYFYPQGVVETSGTPYYYSRDHLGSIREVTTSTGSVVASYAYDPYGLTTQTSGSYVSDLGYEGYLRHSASGLLLTPSRVYAARMGRWLTRDPAGFKGGFNLYGFVGDNPLHNIDPSGRTPISSLTGVLSFADVSVGTMHQISSFVGHAPYQKRVLFPGFGSVEAPIEIDEPPTIIDNPGDDEGPDPWDYNQNNGDEEDDPDSYEETSVLLNPFQYWADRGVYEYDENGNPYLPEDWNPDDYGFNLDDPCASDDGSGTDNGSDQDGDYDGDGNQADDGSSNDADSGGDTPVSDF